MKDAEGEAIEAGDVVQIMPDHGGFFGGCFMLVTEARPWGVVGFIAIPAAQRGQPPSAAYYRAASHEFLRIGESRWVPDDVQVADEVKPQPTGRVVELELAGMCLAARADGQPLLCTIAGDGPFLALFDTLEDCVAFHGRDGGIVERPMRVDEAGEFLASMPSDVRVIVRPREVEPNKWRWLEIPKPTWMEASRGEPK